MPPKFEIFPDRLEITSAGRLPEYLSKEEFFNGISIPRNKELMRIYRDLELVESLGSGIPRILKAYGEECFKFTDNFIRITFPVTAHDVAHDVAHDHASYRASDHASVQVKKLISVLTGEKGRSELQELLSIKNRDYFRTDFWISTIFLSLGVGYKKYCTFTIYFKYSVILNLYKVNELNYKTGI